MEQALSGVQTSDPSIVASPGTPPQVPLEGPTNPARFQVQAAEGARLADETLAQQQAETHALPGVERVPLADVHEAHEVGELTAPVAPETTAPEGAQQYLGLNQPPEVQAAFDEVAGPSMQASMAEAQTQIDQAASERDAAQQAEVQEAQAQAAEAQTQAEADQQVQVAEAQAAIEGERQNAGEQQQAAVADMQQQAQTRQEADRQQFDERAQSDQAQIEQRYQEAESEATSEIAQGEHDARAERDRAERESENQSWWEAALDAIVSFFDALVSAINSIFDAVRSAVNAILDAVRDFAVGLIRLAAQALTSLIEAYGDFLRALVQSLLADIFPGLARALLAAIDTAVNLATRAINAVANGLVAAVNAIVETLRAGLNAVLDLYQSAVNAALSLARAALTGDWSAFWTQLIEAACLVAGLDPQQVFELIGHTIETIQLIVNDPGSFFSNLLEALMGGFRRFAGNFLTHLQAGIIGWLTGTLGGAGIVMPEHFDLMGVLSLVGQILGLTWANIRQRIVRLVGERGMQVIEFAASYIETIITGGWAGLWERIKADLSSIRDIVFEQIRNYLVERIIVNAITYLATLWEPIGWLVNILIATYRFYTFMRDQFQRIMQIVSTVVEAVGNIARGVLDPAQQGVERFLAGLLPLAIDLLARLIGLGDVGGRVRTIITGVQEVVWGAIDRLIARVAALFSGGTAGAPVAATAAAGAGAGAALGELLTIRPAGQPEHTLYITAAGRDASVMVASNPRTIPQLISDWNRGLSGLPTEPEDRQSEARGLIGRLEQGNAETEAVAEDVLTVTAPTSATSQPQAQRSGEQAVLSSERNLVNVLERLFEIFEVRSDISLGDTNASAAEASAAVVERWGAQLRRADPAAAQQLYNDMALSSAAIVAIPAGRWAEVETVLVARSGSFMQSPMRAGAFADAVRRTLRPEVEPSFNEARLQYQDRYRLRRIAGLDPVITPVTMPDSVDDFITSRFGFVNTGRFPFVHSLGAVRQMATDRANTGPSMTMLRQEMAESVVSYRLDSVPEHKLFRPVMLIDTNAPNVRYRMFRYATISPAQFEVTVDESQQVHEVKATGLQLKWVRSEIPRIGSRQGRGVTEDLPLGAADQGLDLNVAHFIADQFLGPGYRDSLNTRYASGFYNQRIMSGVETEIRNYILGFRVKDQVSLSAITFDLTVRAEWGPPIVTQAIVDEISRQILSQTQAGSDERAQLIADIRQTHRRFLAGGSQIQRLLSVTYTMLPYVNTAAQNPARVWTIGPDIYLGLDRAVLDSLFPQEP